MNEDMERDTNDTIEYLDLTPDAHTEEKPARKAKRPTPEEPDLEQLAKQIREELERGSEQAPPTEKAPEDDGTAPKKNAEEEQPEAQSEETPEGQETQEAPEDTQEDQAEAPEDQAEETSEDKPEDKPEETPEEARTRKFRGVFEYVETFCVALGVMILLFMFVFRYVSVDGDSMLPTLHGGKASDHADRLIISDFLYHPKTGDVVVISTGTGEKPLIKRVIAAGGQTVRINFKTWEVSVDGVKLQEDYIWYVEGRPMEVRDMAAMYGVDENGVCEFTVGEDKVFVMGDNRNDSKDSRFREIGEQDVEHILGKVILRLFPLPEFGPV